MTYQEFLSKLSNPAKNGLLHEGVAQATPFTIK